MAWMVVRPIKKIFVSRQDPSNRHIHFWWIFAISIQKFWQINNTKYTFWRIIAIMCHKMAWMAVRPIKKIFVFSHVIHHIDIPSQGFRDMQWHLIILNCWMLIANSFYSLDSQWWNLKQLSALSYFIQTRWSIMSFL